MTDIAEFKPFQVEGISLRYRQKAIAETAIQSSGVSVDLNKKFGIVLADDGRLYFSDNRTNTVPLNKLSNFYERIKPDENGNLTFWNKSLMSSSFKRQDCQSISCILFWVFSLLETIGLIEIYSQIENYGIPCLRSQALSI